MSPELFARLAGNIVGGLLFLAIGYAVARAMQRRRKSESLPKWPIAIGALVALVAVLPAVNRTFVAAEEANATEVKVVRQPANGVTDADITPEYAKEIEAYLLEGIRANMPVDAGEITTGNSSVMVVDGRRIAVNRFAVNGEEAIVSILGIKSGEIVRVTCFTGGGRVDYRVPECASMVRQSLGVELP